MEYIVRLAGFSLKLVSERPLKVEDAWKMYVRQERMNADLTINVSWDWKNAKQPSSKMVGQDAILNFYQEENECYCVSKHGLKGPVASVSYQRDLSGMICTINEKPFISSPDSIGRIMRALPVREILLHFSTLFFHGAQIIYSNKGIVFSAPSGTGKTTQARLWEKWKSAEIVCNDRTLVRKVNGNYYTFGYPLDGSDPVFNSDVHQLGAIVLLEQGRKNEIHTLSPMQAVTKMMEQMVMDCWNPIAREKTVHLLLEMIEKIPVYLYSCTPDKESVEILYQHLLQKEVIEIG